MIYRKGQPLLVSFFLLLELRELLMNFVPPDIDPVPELGHVLMTRDVGDGQALVACHVLEFDVPDCTRNSPVELV